MKTYDRRSTIPFTTSKSRAGELLRWLNAHARLLLTVLVLAWIFVITVAAIRKLQLYRMGFDLAFTQQIVWNTLHGRPFETYAYDFTNSVLGVDSYFIWLWFVPFYALFPNPATLLAVQTAIVGSAAVPVYLLARDHLKQRWAALAMAAVYLAYLPVVNGSLYETRERMLAMAFLTWLLLCLERRWFWRMVIAMLLMLSCRLDTTIAAILVGCYTLLLRVRPTMHTASRGDDRLMNVYAPPPWRYSLTLIGSGVATYILVTKVMIPRFTDKTDYMLLDLYRYLGNSPGEIIINLVTNPLNTSQILFAPPKPWYLLGIFLPFVFLPLLNWRLMLVTIPLFGINFLSPRPAQWDVYHHFHGLVVPLLTLAAILSLAALVRRGALGVNTLHWGIGAMLCATLATHVLYGNPLPGIFKRWQPTERALAANPLIPQVPPDVSLAVSNVVSPHVPPRRELYLFPSNDPFYVAEPLEKADYALVDWNGPEERSEIEAAIAAGGWCVVADEARYRLLKKQPGAHGERCGS